MNGSAVIVVTGARKGLGRAIAEHFLRRGHAVAGISREMSDLVGDRYAHFRADVADEEAVKQCMGLIAARFGAVDAIVNNAGIASMNHALLTTAAAMQRIFETNALGSFLCAREAAKLMRRKKLGRIVNVSSVAVPMALAGEAAYAASKAAVETLTRVLAREFAPLGITCNAVGPTPIRTDLLAGVAQNKIDALVARQALPRLGEPRDVINAIEFFMRADSDFITGQVLYLGGVW
jgi:3-oxoacyl-[acyl-carrier protein] reductase